MESVPQNETSAESSPTSRSTYDDWVDLITHLWAISGDRIPHAEELATRAKGFARLLGPHFLGQMETDYVIEQTAKHRIWRGPIHADELLRTAEKVFGCPKAMWGYPDADCEPLVWSDAESNWILLATAIERIKQAQPKMPTEEILTLIYGGF